ncbi:putative NADPH-quinone reductase [Humitalea rosea]|uniref:Putative NADPH-quinone reductase n=1 Tax=Humitalea rosea TaxID=990373 RepID=A0A2W7IRU9_9PROT|nr:NAD(P)H-dependent oxidoreductase [Humitalea rosea]PZW50331.1 putative NADPH-quinone reductase [Humitalea rosea]
MSTTTILMFHPDPSRSRANATLAAAAAELPGVEVVDMQALYPTGEIDVEREVARLLAAGRIVLQFPVQWYATPPLLKAWQDSVLTRMFYIAYEREGRALEGTPLLVAATAGNTPAAYAPTGANLFSLEELLRPLEATAHRCGLPWSQPFLLFGANRLDAPALAEAAGRYVARLGMA